MKTVFIYTLTDPTTSLVRYVGCSKNPFVRWYTHCREFSKGAKYIWVQTLKAGNLLPLVDLLDEVPENIAEETEAEYIRVFKSIGIPLLNVQRRTSRRKVKRRRRSSEKPERKSNYFRFHTKHRALILIQRAKDKRLALTKNS